MMVLVVGLARIPCSFNMGRQLWPWKVEQLLLKEVIECGLARDFSQFFRISGSVSAQQCHPTARHCIRSMVIGVGNGMTERPANSLNLAPL